MRIKVTYNPGMTSGYSKEGEVLSWGSTVEEFPSDYGRIQQLQVPSVTINSGNKIIVCPLKKYLEDVEVQVLDTNEQELGGRVSDF